MNRVVELVQKIAAEQRKPWDEERETDEQYLGRKALEDKWIGSLEYHGNTIEWTCSKAVNYGRALQQAWDELVKLGIPCDGNTSVAEAIHKFCIKK